MKNQMVDAFELKRKGYYKQAIEMYYKIMSVSGCDIEILAELSELYFLLSNNERAFHYAQKALEINPEHISTLNIIKKIYVSEKKYADAENTAKKIYDKTLSAHDLSELVSILEIQKKYEDVICYTQNTNDAECLYKRAFALYNLKRFEDALNVLNSVINTKNIDKQISEKVFGLIGKIYYEQNNIENAKEVFNKLEENKPEDAQNLNFIGLNKLDELKTDEAVEYFKKAAEKEPDNPEYYFNLAQTYFFKGWFDEAKKCFNTALCLAPGNESYHYALAYLFYRLGDYENAKAHLNPEYFESKILLQIIKAETGNLASSKFELENMLKENPNNELILCSLAKIYYKLDLFKQAKFFIKKALEINSKSFEYQSLYLKLLIKLKMFDEAAQKAEMLLQKYPNYYYAKVLEAELNLEKKDYDALFESAQNLIELDTNHYEGYYYNACALFEKEDINFAVESLKKAISLDAANADLYVKMSEFYQALGRYEDALAYIKEAGDIDRSEKNKELYMQLASVLRKKGNEKIYE